MAAGRVASLAPPPRPTGGRRAAAILLALGGWLITAIVTVSIANNVSGALDGWTGAATWAGLHLPLLAGAFRLGGRSWSSSWLYASVLTIVFGAMLVAEFFVAIFTAFLFELTAPLWIWLAYKATPERTLAGGDPDAPPPVEWRPHLEPVDPGQPLPGPTAGNVPPPPGSPGPLPPPGAWPPAPPPIDDGRDDDR